MINKANGLPKSQNHKSRTSRDIGISAEKPPKETISKGCAEEKNKEIKKAKVLPSKYILESCTRKDCSLVAEIECSPTVSNKKVMMLKIDKAKIISKTSRELIWKKQELSFDQEIISFMRKCLIWSSSNRWPYKN